ncbi:hypothetical protein D4Z93_03340 [Clostridium fermenticellae]|uniref:Uncharacterized protein n=1 Tax=Clostridium fermenticellae TaxID=2068654 RepID=A0A386H1R5_9CLOT|nr:hypothetical protein [Clostridium fermenticellae]AYD39606.1 hypothetical protein D4Z93_03340 [Clostridium fermenticellae]
MNTLQSIEKDLINYFNKDKKINVLNKKLEILKRQITEIDSKLQSIDVDLPEDPLSINMMKGYKQAIAVKVMQKEL